jgi:flagellum-specific peptidoglycan hydrolase FlgJ
MKGGEVTESNPNGYAIYKNWKHSCRAYCRWQRHWYGDSTQDYYQFLSNIGYAESPTYIDKLKSIKLIIVKR